MNNAFVSDTISSTFYPDNSLFLQPPQAVLDPLAGFRDPLRNYLKSQRGQMASLYVKTKMKRTFMGSAGVMEVGEGEGAAGTLLCGTDNCMLLFTWGC